MRKQEFISGERDGFPHSDTAITIYHCTQLSIIKILSHTSLHDSALCTTHRIITQKKDNVALTKTDHNLNCNTERRQLKTSLLH